MPNHVDNLVRMRNIGTRKELFTETEDGDVNLDFGKILPMPGGDDLLNVSSPMSDYAVDLAMKALIIRLAAMPRYQYNGAFKDVATKLSNIPLQVPNYYVGREVDALTEGLQYIKNIVSYGYSTWYEWCTCVWGTKWNSYWGSIIGDNMIRFTTAWDIPQNIYLELSHQNPYDEIIVDWVNEGGTFGQTRFLDGEQIEEKVYTYTEDFEDEYDNNRLFHKVKLIEHHKK